MKSGDIVKVYPHGSPDRASEGKVMLCSGNQLSIAVAFAERPPFVIDRSGGVAIHTEEQAIMMLAARVELNGMPWGPWVEVFGGGHFEIEEKRDGRSDNGPG